MERNHLDCSSGSQEEDGEGNEAKAESTARMAETRPERRVCRRAGPRRLHCTRSYKDTNNPVLISVLSSQASQVLGKRSGGRERGSNRELGLLKVNIKTREKR